MKRSELIQKLVNEGMSAKTLANFSDNQINNLAKRMIGEQETPKGSVVMKKGTNPADIKKMTDLGMNVALNEKLKGNQDKLDKNHNDKIDAQDFKILKGQKKKKEDMKEADMGLTVKAPKSSGSIFGAPVKAAKSATAPKKKVAPKKKEDETTEEGEMDESLHGIIHGAIKDKLSKDLGREPEDHEIEKAHQDFVDSWKKEHEKKEDGHKKDKHNPVKVDEPNPKGGKKEEEDESEMEESKPSDGLSKEKKSEVVKKAKKGGDIGKKGKGFEKLADKAAKEYGSKEKGEKVAAAAMWKNLNREQVEVNNWVNNLAESNFYNNFTSKEEIMELISTKLTEADMAVAHGPNVKKGHNNVPEFMSYDSIKSAGPATKPKPTVKPGTKPGEKPKTPYQPGPGPNPKPKASFE